MDIFVDTDVVISSLLSTTGAAYFLLTELQSRPVVSDHSLSEIKKVASRFGIRKSKLTSIVKNRLTIVNIETKLSVLKRDYSKYVTDINDAHIVAGADKAKVKYLITYNTRHFITDRIKDDLDIIVMTPALFLQFLRSN